MQRDGRAHCSEEQDAQSAEASCADDHDGRLVRVLEQRLASVLQWGGHLSIECRGELPSPGHRSVSHLTTCLVQSRDRLGRIKQLAAAEQLTRAVHHQE
jgi:hypothetical protein